jgi:hypothetical protein
MKKQPPSKEISPTEFYQLVLDGIQNPGSIPKDDWLPPEVIIDGYIVNNRPSIEDQLEFKDIDLEKVRLCFLNCRLKGRYIFNSIKLRSITFSYSEIDVIELNNSILEVFNYQFSKSLGLTLREVKLRQFFAVRDSEIANSIRLANIESKGQIGISNVDSKNLTITESHSNFNFCSGKYDNVRLVNNNFSSAKILSLNNRALSITNPLQITNDNAEYKYGRLELGPDFNNSAVIKGTSKAHFDLNELVIADSVFTNIRVTIDQININSISFKEFVNTGQLDLFNIEFPSNNSKFHLENSFLGKTQIFNCILPNNIDFRFTSSDIKEVSYNNVSWPDNLSNQNVEERLELYRQLKHVANKNYDIINSVRFYSVEKNAFYKTLNWSWKDFGTKLIFRFNSWSNNNNVSWLKPIGLNIVIQFSLFLLIGFILFFSDYVKLQEFIYPITKFLFLLNPAFKTDEIDPGIDENWATIILSLFSRIISAYLIYQTISAYRRYK